jgi:hypothetical protein
MRHGELARMVFRDRITRVHMVEVAPPELGCRSLRLQAPGHGQVARPPRRLAVFVVDLREGGSGIRCFGNGLSDRILSPIVLTNAPVSASVWRFACYAIAKES